MTTRNSTPSGKVMKSHYRCQERWLKVNTVNVPPTKQQLKENPYRGYRSLPCLYLKGLWLEEAGFLLEDPVKVRVMEGCIVLTVETPPVPDHEIVSHYIKEKLVPQNTRKAR